MKTTKFYRIGLSILLIVFGILTIKNEKYISITLFLLLIIINFVIKEKNEG